MDPIRILQDISDTSIVPEYDEIRNPYRILTKENGQKTAYIFSCPIYNFEKHELISQVWNCVNGINYFNGINSSIAYSNKKINLANFMGQTELSFSDNYSIYPSTNGIRVVSKTSDIRIELKNTSEYSIKKNHTSLALMAEKHLPFINISPLFGKNANKELFPAFIEYHPKNETEGTIQIFTPKPCIELSTEINLYLPKVIFDTTIQSKFPDENNVYGNYALLGKSQDLGEQLLLLRLNNSDRAFRGINDIEKAEMFIPKLGSDKALICAHEILHGWCTFNTNFETRPAVSSEFSVLKEHSGYLVANITELLKNKNFGLMLENHNKHALCAISTGDSYENPIIIRIQYN